MDWGGVRGTDSGCTRRSWLDHDARPRVGPDRRRNPAPWRQLPFSRPDSKWQDELRFPFAAGSSPEKQRARIDAPGGIGGDGVKVAHATSPKIEVVDTMNSSYAPHRWNQYSWFRAYRYAHGIFWLLLLVAVLSLGLPRAHAAGS